MYFELFKRMSAMFTTFDQYQYVTPRTHARERVYAYMRRLDADLTQNRRHTFKTMEDDYEAEQEAHLQDHAFIREQEDDYEAEQEAHLQDHAFIRDR